MKPIEVAVAFLLEERAAAVARGRRDCKALLTPIEGEVKMPIMNDRQSVAANATVQNVLAGKIDEFLKQNSVINLFANAEAVGLNVTLIVGQQVVVDDQEIANRAAGTAIVKPDDFVIQSGGLAGDRLILRLRNTTGAAIIARTQVAIDPA